MTSDFSEPYLHYFRLDNARRTTTIVQGITLELLRSDVGPHERRRILEQVSRGWRYRTSHLAPEQRR